MKTTKKAMRGAMFALAMFTAASAADAAELTHRWSFNGDYADSVGGSTATVIGSQASIRDWQVELRGSGNGAGSLNMGSNLLDVPEATVEIWATQRSVKNWARVFDYGPDTDNYFILAWSSGTTFTVDRAAAKVDGVETDIDGTMSPYEFGVKYHIAATFQVGGDGKTTVRFTRRNAKTGALEKTGTLEMAGSFAGMANPVLYIGHSQYSGDWDAYADYDEVRVWKGILTDEQLAANAVRGPDDTTPGGTELPASPTGPAFATWIGGTPSTAADLENAANWSCTDADGNAVAGAAPGPATTVVIPAGETTFTIPAGVAPAWAGIRFGPALAATQWGMITYGVKRGGMADDFSTDWVHLPIASYSAKGFVTDLSTLLSANSIKRNQFRVDGWFFVDASKAGFWALKAGLDDYLALLVDGCIGVMTHTFSAEYTSNWYLTAGWHRFTVICGDTYGGNSTDLNRLTFTAPDGTTGAFHTLTFSGEQPVTVKLNADCNLAALGTVLLSNGVTLDLNGHNLIVEDINSDFVGTKVVNMSGAESTLFCVNDPSLSAGLPNLVLENVQAVRANSYIWSGAAGDCKFSTLGNWQLVNGAVPEELPVAGTSLLFTGVGGAITNDLENLGGDAITFAAGAGAFTIEGNAFRNVPIVANKSGSVQTMAGEVFFADTYKVSLVSSSVNFAGGATATFPDESMRSQALCRRLVGKFNFTGDWVVPATGSELPWIVAEGSEVHGGLLTGTQHSHRAILRVDEGGSAYFHTITNGWDRGDVDIDGYLELSNEFIVRSCPTPSDNWSRFGREGNKGTVKARRIAKSEHAWAQSFIPNLIVGEGGIGSVMQDYSWRFYTNTTITAYADFECLGVYNQGNTSDWGLTVMTGFTLTFNVPEGLTVTCGAGMFGDGAVRKTGAGTLAMGNSFDGAEGFTKTYAGGTAVDEGVFKVDAANSVGSGPVTLSPGATLAIRRGVTLDKLAVPTSGVAMLRPCGDFQDVGDGMRIQLATLESGSVGNLALDTSGMNMRRGFRTSLIEADGVVYLHFRKNGVTLYIR